MKNDVPDRSVDFFRHGWIEGLAKRVHCCDSTENTRIEDTLGKESIQRDVMGI